MNDRRGHTASMVTHLIAIRTSACILALVLGLTLAGCAQGQSGATSTSGATTHVEAPAPDAEIADVTTVAYLGPKGTYTEEAALLFFGENDELMPQETVADALALVADGKASYAVIPQENTLGGPVTDYIDAFLKSDKASVVGEVILPIRQTLMGLPGTDLSHVKHVFSHKQGLAQSAKWLDENLPDAERVEAAPQPRRSPRAAIQRR